MPLIDFVVVAAWLLWSAAPPSVIPPAPVEVEVYVPPLVLLLLLGGTLAGVAVGRGREVLPWLGIAILSVPLAFELFFVAVWVTFPADF